MRRSSSQNAVLPIESLQVYLLGTVDFEAALSLQKRLLYDISGDRNQAALILCEHPPIITVGRQGSRAHILYEDEELLTRRWRIRWVNRGGGCILHYPGQLAVYPILPLDRFGFSLRDYLRLLGTTFQDLFSEFGLFRQAQPTPLGMAVGSRLLAAYGVAVRDWISYYGAYLNVQPPLDMFRRVQSDAARQPMTSLERERRGPVRFAHLRERLIEIWQHRLGCQRVALFSDHSFLTGISQHRRQLEKAGMPTNSRGPF